VFGSVLYGEDTEASDLDLLLDSMPETSIFDIGEVRYQLHTLLGVSVESGHQTRFMRSSRASEAN
jgi:predicted nucleotidyltransferase